MIGRGEDTSQSMDGIPIDAPIDRPSTQALVQRLRLRRPSPGFAGLLVSLIRFQLSVFSSQLFRAFTVLASKTRARLLRRSCSPCARLVLGVLSGVLGRARGVLASARLKSDRNRRLGIFKTPGRVCWRHDFLSVGDSFCSMASQNRALASRNQLKSA